MGVPWMPAIPVLLANISLPPKVADYATEHPQKFSGLPLSNDLISQSYDSQEDPKLCHEPTMRSEMAGDMKWVLEVPILLASRPDCDLDRQNQKGRLEILTRSHMHHISNL